jgi:Circadian oscillating protein COP23
LLSHSTSHRHPQPSETFLSLIESSLINARSSLLLILICLYLIHEGFPMKNSTPLIGLSLALVLSANAAWGESKIERDTRDGAPTTQPARNPGGVQTTNQSTSQTNGRTTSQTNTQTNTQTNGQSQPVKTTAARFACENVNSQLTVVYRPQSRPEEAYPWAVPGDMGAAWNSQKRCTEIARRLESYRPDGLQELRTGIQNQQKVVCVTTEKNQSCRIVFTVPAQQDAIATRDRVFRNLTMADGGQQTEGVNTFAGGGGSDILDGITGQRPTAAKPKGSAIDLRPYLSQQDGGTGNRIGNPVAVPQQYRLNPENFR